MKKTIILMSVLFAWATSLSAQVTREQADAIVLNYLNREMAYPYALYVNANAPNEEGFTIITEMEEAIKVKHACWVYRAKRIFSPPPCENPPECPQYVMVHPFFTGYNYIFVKEDDGSLLEVITHQDGLIGNSNSWIEVKAPTGLVEPKENDKFLYPNPVDDWLTIPCNGENIRVEIYDLKGTRLFSGTLSDKDACRLNVSFLSAGIYMVNVSGKMYKVIKN